MKQLVLPLLVAVASALTRPVPDNCADRCKAVKDSGFPTVWVNPDPQWAGTIVDKTWTFGNGKCEEIASVCSPTKDCTSTLAVLVSCPAQNLWNLHPPGWTTNCTTYPNNDLWCKRPWDQFQGGQEWIFTKNTPCGAPVAQNFDFNAVPNGTVVASVRDQGTCSSCLPPPAD